jgi:RNA polymerase I-specific transcription initiation factor RRN7
LLYADLKGPKAVELYLKCLQLILRHQLWFLVQEKGLPTELETVVQDLWALRIVQFESRITNARQEFDSSQALTAASDTETDFETNPLGPGNRAKKLKETPNLVDSLVLCYLGIITLRLPVTPGDLYSWTTDGKLPYRRAIALLPKAMRDRLPANYHAVLDPNSLLSLKRFYSTLVDLQVGFEKESGILWPPLNAPLLLFHYLKKLALPLELYSAVIRLGDLLEYDFALHTNGKDKRGVRHVPEAHLAACLVVCVKLFYSFEEKRQYPSSASEPTTTTFSWKIWSTIIGNAKPGNRGGDHQYSMEELTKLQEKDVFSMSGDQLDRYLDFYLNNFVDETHIEANGANDDFRNALYNLFPVTTTTEPLQDHQFSSTYNDKQLDVVRAVQGRTKPIPVIAVGEESSLTQRPGHGYVVYTKESNLPEHAKMFYREVARLAGLTLDMLIMAVFSMEKRIQKWTSTQQREMKKAVG